MRKKTQVDIQEAISNACEAIGVFDVIKPRIISGKIDPQKVIRYYELEMFSLTKKNFDGVHDPKWIRMEITVQALELHLEDARYKLSQSFKIYFKPEDYSQAKTSNLLKKKVELTEKLDSALTFLREKYPELVE